MSPVHASRHRGLQGTTGSPRRRSHMTAHDACGAITVLGGVGCVGVAACAARRAGSAHLGSACSARAVDAASDGRVRARARGRRRSGPAGGAADSAPVKLTAGAKEGRAAGSGPPPASGAPSSSEPPSPPPASPTQPSKIDLSFEALRDEAKERLSGPAVPSGTLRARPGRFAVDELRVELERERDAVANVDAGRIDPLLLRLPARGARRFQDPAERLADDLAVGARDMVRGWGRGYLRHRRQGESRPARRPGGRPARGERRRAQRDIAGRRRARRYDEARRQAEAGAEERRAEVCLDVAAGRETARRAPPRLRQRRARSPRAGVVHEGGRRAPRSSRCAPGLACYELHISAFRMPPLPFISCGVGRPGLTCVWPFKKVTSVKGRLLGVEYPAADGARPPRCCANHADAGERQVSGPAFGTCLRGSLVDGGRP